MANRRSNQGENNTDGFDYQHYTMLYITDTLMSKKNKFPDFQIGSGLVGYGALDDIVLNVTIPDSIVRTNLLQVKHSNQTIHETYLCFNDKTYVNKYFETYLDIKKCKSDQFKQLDQLIIWTNMAFGKDVENWFEIFNSNDDRRDVFHASDNLSFKRFRFRKAHFDDISYLFHTRMKLVYEIVEGLFEQKWDPKSAAKSYFLTMAKEIIGNYGEELKFKDEFIKGQYDKYEEKACFRKCFNVAMGRKFLRKKLGSAFLMHRLNSKEYRKYYNLDVIGDKVQVQWKEWKTEEDNLDLEDFRQRFVFYVEMPGVKALKEILRKKINNFTQLSDFLKECAFKKMISKRQYERIILLLNLRHVMELGPYNELKFEEPAECLSREVMRFLAETNMDKYFSVKAPQDVSCTVSRLLPYIKTCLAPLNDRYLVLNLNNFHKHFSHLEQILVDTMVVENGLKCIVITDVSGYNTKLIEEKLSFFGVKVIFVGKHLDFAFVDEFDVGKLHPACKDVISSREIFLSAHYSVTASQIFENELFRKENHQLALSLFQSQRQIQLDTGDLEFDKHFIPRIIHVNQKSMDMLDLIHNDAYKQIVISDQAGMGKSTELIYTAIEMRNAYRDSLIIYLDSKAALRFHDEKQELGHIVCKVNNIRGGAPELVARKIIEMGKAIILLDGLDEVSDSCRIKLENMLCTISKANIFKLVIATRPHCSTLVQRIFPSSIICQLEKFSESDQLKYLKSFWKVEELPEIKRNQIVENATELINRFRSMLKDGSLIGIPLQTYMIALIFESLIVSEHFEQPKPYQIGNIYKKFIELKLDESIKRSKYDSTVKAHENAIRIHREKFIPDHIRVAQKIYTNAPEHELFEICNQLQPDGLVRLQPSLGFIHHTYFQFFLSFYFLTYETNLDVWFVSFMQQNLCTSRESIVTKFMDFHIDEINPTRQLETVNSSKSQLSNNFQPPSNGRLHPDKLREFHQYLSDHCTEIQHYTLIRNSFNLSVFNVFEVLYDSLPTKTKSSMKFRFGNKQEAHFINLKLLGSNQVLQLLNILVKKNPGTFVQQYLTDFALDEEDFIEIACRKPFVNVLNWLANDLLPEIKSDIEQNALIDYLSKKFDKYFLLIVMHNNAQFFQTAIQFSKNLWARSVINRFLLEYNVLLLFLNTIELPCNTKPLNVNQRVDMVHQINDLYRWAFDGNFPVNHDCRNAFTKLTIDAIKCAFIDAFSDK